MERPNANAVSGGAKSPRWSLAVVLLVVGLLGHVLAAHALGGYRLAYVHHLLGFCFILVVTGGIIALLGWRYWRGRRDTMWLVIGAVQALFGIAVYVAQIGYGIR